jgi:hypothetical protein
MQYVTGLTESYHWLLDCGESTEACQHPARAPAVSNGLPFSIAATLALIQDFAAAWLQRDAAASREFVARLTEMERALCLLQT